MCTLWWGGLIYRRNDIHGKFVYLNPSDLLITFDSKVDLMGCSSVHIVDGCVLRKMI
jgi:hypothetical protein